MESSPVGSGFRYPTRLCAKRTADPPATAVLSKEDSKASWVLSIINCFLEQSESIIVQRKPYNGILKRKEAVRRRRTLTAIAVGVFLRITLEMVNRFGRLGSLGSNDSLT